MARLWTREAIAIVAPEAETCQRKSTKLAIRAREGLRKVALGEAQTITGWLEYGAALNEARRNYPKGDNTRFHEWLSTNNLLGANDMERTAAMWAAAAPAEFATTQVLNPKVRTVRGLHAKWKEGLHGAPKGIT